MTVQPLKVYEKVFLTMVLDLARQIPVIFDLAGQVTFGPRFCQLLQIFFVTNVFTWFSLLMDVSPSFLSSEPKTIFVPISTTKSTLISLFSIKALAMLTNLLTGTLSGL